MKEKIVEPWFFVDAEVPRTAFKEELRGEVKKQFQKRQSLQARIVSSWISQIAIGFCLVIILSGVILPGVYDRRQGMRLADSSAKVSDVLVKNFEEQDAELKELEVLLLEFESLE